MAEFPVGFQWKGTSKRQKIVQTSSESSVRINQLITSIEGKKIELLHKDDGPQQLVIPLIQRHYNTENVQRDKSNKVDLDKLAEQEILAELVESDKQQKESSLVIHQGSNTMLKPTNGPLLAHSIDPHLRSLHSDEDRYRYDMQNRASDVSVKSEVYESVPIEQFGAAMLRGMGWSGYSEEEAKKVDKQYSSKLVARDGRTGLGQVQFPDRSKKGNKDKESKSIAGILTVSGRSQEVATVRRFHVEDIVYVGADSSRERAKIIATKGVPGLNRVRLQMERNENEILELSKDRLCTVSEEDLLLAPYKHGSATAYASSSQTVYHGLKGSGDAVVVEQGASVAVVEEIPTAAKIEQPKVVKEVVAPPSVPTVRNWIWPQIRVKIVSKRPGSEFYLQKGTVVDVPAAGIASVRLSSGRIVDSVAEKYLETVLPAVQGVCLVLTGPHRGQHATMLSVDKDRNLATVQLSEDLEVMEMNLDNIAAMS